MPKNYEFTFFSQKCRHDFIHTLFFFNNIILHGPENERILIFEIIDNDTEKKIERKGGARVLAVSIF